MQMTFRNKVIIGMAGMSFLAVVGYFFIALQSPIYEYNAATDKDEIVALYEKDKYWLTDSPESTIEFMLKYKAHDRNPASRGKLQVKVLKEDDKFAGFTAYYMADPHIGKILFLAVKHEFRGKKYGTLLMNYAIKQLQKMGAKEIVLVTRTTNFPAQKIYTDIGFTETLRDDDYGYVYYSYVPA